MSSFILQIKIGVIVLNEQNQVLLIKEKVEKHAEPLWNIIKGTYDNHEEDILQVAVREYLEEAYACVVLTHLLGIYIVRDNSKTTLQFGFLGIIQNKVPKVPTIDEQKMHGEEIHEVRWFNRSTVSAMNPSEFVSPKSYALIRDWISGKKYPLEILRIITKRRASI